MFSVYINFTLPQKVGAEKGCTKDSVSILFIFSRRQNRKAR